MTRSDGAVEDRYVAAFRPHFDEDGIVEPTGLIACQNLLHAAEAVRWCPKEAEVFLK